MHIQKIILIPLSLLGILATFLPWQVMPGIPSTDGTGGAGWITAGIFFIILLAILIGNFRYRLSGFTYTCISILSILAAIYGILLTDKTATGISNSLDETSASTGIGLYILIISGLLIPVLGFFLRGPKKQNRTTEQVQLNITVVEDKKNEH